MQLILLHCVPFIYKTLSLGLEDRGIELHTKGTIVTTVDIPFIQHFKFFSEQVAF